MGKPREILEQEKDGIKIVLEQIRLIRQQRSGRRGGRSTDNLHAGDDSGSSRNGAAEMACFEVKNQLNGWRLARG